MNQTLNDYYREVEEKAEQFAKDEEMRRRLDHIESFNFGRLVQRTQSRWYDAILRFGWLIAGVGIGLICGKVHPW